MAWRADFPRDPAIRDISLGQVDHDCATSAPKTSRSFSSRNRPGLKVWRLLE